MIAYSSNQGDLDAEDLQGFFVGWPTPPTPEQRVEVLWNSYAVEFATDTDTNKVVGFVNAISDGVLMAYLPLLEVLPDYQGRGIGTELVRRMLDRLQHLYGVDVCCDEDVANFYGRFDMIKVTGMVKRSARLGPNGY
jgi:ribosomal protein S18 acetylase RimI-like enzyme